MKHIPCDFDTLIPILIKLWRNLQRLPAGPQDRLQTREFNALIEAITKQQKEKKIESTEEVGAYLLYDWLVHYAQGLSLIEELPHTPYRVLDIAAGAAPMSLAALRHGAREVYAIDHNLKLLECGAHISGHYGHPLTIREHNCLDKKFPVQGPWDLIILSHSFFLLCPQEEEARSYLTFLMNQLTKTGFLLIVESSEESVNRRIIGLRDFAVEHGYGVQAPCICKGACPLQGSSPCYAQRPFEKPPLVKDIQRLVGINLSSLKMSYLLLKPNPTPARPDKKFFRVISPSVQTFWGKRFYLCTDDGKRTLGLKAETAPKSARAFDYLKRGDVISISDAVVEKNDMQIDASTKIILEAPVAKPFTETEG